MPRMPWPWMLAPAFPIASAMTCPGSSAWIHASTEVMGYSLEV